MKKNIFLRVALVLLTLTLGVTSVSFAFTGARFESQNIMSNEFAVYHLISFVRTGLGRGTLNASFIGTGASHTTFNNAPAGEWAFFVRGGHGTDQDLAGSGRPGVFMGIFDKTTAGSFTVGVIQGAARTGPAIGTTNSGHGGHMAYIMSNRTFPTSNPGNTTGFVAIAGGGGGRGGDNNMRGGDAGGQTGIAGAANWRFINGVVSPAPTYPTWSETGFLGGFSGNQGNTANQAHTTSNTGGTTGSGGGGGAGVTGGRATGGQNGNANFAAGWVIGAAGTAAGSGGGGGAGVFGGGGGGGVVGQTGRAGGGGSSFSAASAAVPARPASPVTYRDHAIQLFWDLVGTAHTDTTRGSDGRIVLVWLGPTA